MRRIPSLLVLPALLSVSTAAAGPNEGGVLILHNDPSIALCFESYAGRSDLARCEDANTYAPTGSPVVFWVHAAFPTDGSPRLSSVSFGIDYPEGTVILLGQGGSGDGALDTVTWPTPGSGTTVTWNTPRTDFVPEVYWFVGYEYYALGSSFDLTVHPDALAGFQDDSIPPLTDVVAEFGTFGFGTNPGTLPCPVGPPIGACCADDGSCQMLTGSGCADAGGEFFSGSDCNPTPCLGACCFGDGGCTIDSAAHCGSTGGDFLATGTVCDPNPCPPPPGGACCTPDGVCSLLSEAACSGGSGIYLGDGTSCDPDPCPDPGACCFGSGACAMRQEADCENSGGSFLGEGSACEPNPCPQPDGACCAGTECTVETEESCLLGGGTFGGDFSSCTPEICTESGACCFGATCEIRLLAGCLGEGGIFLGNSVPCDPGACLAWDCDGELRSLAELGAVGPVGRLEPLTIDSPESGRHAVPHASDPGVGVPCGEELFNSDGTYESGYSWGVGGGDGYGPPCFGAFAESFAHAGPVCAIVLDLSQTGNQNGQLLDLYVWENGDGHPGAVRAVAVGVDPGPVGVWPSVSRHVLPVSAEPEGDLWWAGYWGGTGVLFVGADLDGPEPAGTPMTLIQPGSGWSEDGWQDVSFVWDPTQALGIGVQVAEPTEVPETTERATVLSLAAPSPNPASDRLRIEFTLGADERVRIRLLDVQGRLVSEATRDPYTRGPHRIDWELPHSLSSGTYFLLVEAGGEVATRTVTVTR